MRYYAYGAHSAMEVDSIPVTNLALVQLLFGKNDENLRLIEAELGVSVVLRDDVLSLRGASDDCLRARRLIEDLTEMLVEGHNLDYQQLRGVVEKVKQGAPVDVCRLASEVVFVTKRGKKIQARTDGQREYVKAIRDNEVVFVVGPAGTGKTYLAVAMAAHYLQAGQVVRIILARPTVEAGENLGFLPGGLEEKVAPYLRPLYDALYEVLLAERFHSLLERGVIEIAPLAYMRGRTLNDAFIILDEAQNTTYEQMKMFLTRLGFGSKVVVTGDVTQIDLPSHRGSGLVEVQSLFEDIRGINTVYLTGNDVVRHRLVQEIVNAYEKYEKTTRKIQKNGASGF